MGAGIMKDTRSVYRILVGDTWMYETTLETWTEKGG
jgi:hypothetical protein